MKEYSIINTIRLCHASGAITGLYRWVLVIGFFCSTGSGFSNQGLITRIYNAADNSTRLIKITEGAYGIAGVYLKEDEALSWVLMEIIYADINQEYLQIKSTKTGCIYALYVDWNNNKAILEESPDKKTAYWLIKPEGEK